MRLPQYRARRGWRSWRRSLHHAVRAVLGLTALVHVGVVIGANVSLFLFADQMAQQKEARPSRISAPESEQFKRWDQDKKLQRRLEQLRDKLNTKTSEHEAMRQQVEQHRTTIARLDRERGLLKAKLRAREAHDAAGGRGQGREMICGWGRGLNELPTHSPFALADVPSLMAKVDTLQQELAVTKANLRDAEHQVGGGEGAIIWCVGGKLP